MKVRGTADEPKRVADADICGRLPSGERCVLDPGHDGDHYGLEWRLVPTDHQDHQDDQDDEPSITQYVAQAWADDWDNPDDAACDDDASTFDPPEETVEEVAHRLHDGFCVKGCEQPIGRHWLALAGSVVSGEMSEAEARDLLTQSGI